jgi:hypothetical protein
MARPVHPNKEIEAAILYAEWNGWRFVKTKGHGWCRLLCPSGTREGCQISVWSTPRNPEGHARAIRRGIDRCEHGADDEDV